MPLSQTARKLRRLLETADEPVRGQSLAERLRVSRRHLRRLVKALDEAGVPVLRHQDGRHRRFSIPEEARRNEIPVHLSPRAMQRLYELAKEDDHEASAEAETDLARALRAEP